MTQTAEEALAALARDLIEEIAAGRALELAQSDPGTLELATVNVRPFQRTQRVRGREVTEEVRAHTENRLPGQGLEHPISEASWLKGQQEWKQAGEAIWRQNQWKDVDRSRTPGQPHAADVDVPRPKTGAAAVHPHMGGHLAKLPGDTISGHAHAHVPRPLPVHAPDQRDLAVQAAQHALAMRHAQDQMQLQDDMARAQAERTGIPLPGTYAPLTDDQYAAHVVRAEHLIASELAAGHSTDKTETLDGHGQAWKPERAAVHNEIVKSYLDKAVTVPSEGKGLMMGGLGGAGKTTVLKQIPEIDLTRYAVVNPDDIKEELARRGMIPQIEGLSPMEASALVHEESSHIANLIAQELYARNKNIAWDITMSSGRSAARRIDQMEHHGYGEVQGVFVHIPVETSVERARARHRRGLEKYRQGNGSGGRLVPADLIRAAETKPGSTANREAFESLRGRFNAWQLWHNSGTKPVLVEKSKPPQGTGILSVEDLMRQQAKTLSSEAAARAAEKGQPAPVG